MIRFADVPSLGKVERTLVSVVDGGEVLFGVGLGIGVEVWTGRCRAMV